MATRNTNKAETSQRAQRLGRRMLAGLFLFVVCVLVVDALVGDQGLMATMRARKQYDRLVSDLARVRYENASLRLGHRVLLPEVTGDMWWWIVELDPRTATATVRTEMFEMPREMVVSLDQIAQSWAA